jgi:hypothetical protein
MNYNDGVVKKLMEDQTERGCKGSSSSSESSSLSEEKKSKVPEYVLEALNKPLSFDKTPIEALAHLADMSVAATGLPILETDEYARKNAINYAVSSLVLTMPISMEGAILRSKESSIELLNRAAYVHQHFIQRSHAAGPNYHNVSLTVNYKSTKEEENEIMEWLLSHTDCYAGVSLFPDFSNNSDGTAVKYPQMPFEEIDKETYDKWMDAWSTLGLLAREVMLRDILKEREEEKKKEEIVEEKTEEKKVVKEKKKVSIDEDENLEKQRVLEYLISKPFSNVDSSNNSPIGLRHLTPPAPSSPSSELSPPNQANIDKNFQIIRMGMSTVLWDPKAKDTRKQTLACAGGNCEYV